ncbi:MAG: hypothetical protein QW667_07755 [Candidatus Bathyarchaeia archaeon]
MEDKRVMPAVSIETFFACSLMVLITLAAMASTSKILIPQINNMANYNFAERCMEISKYLLLNAGEPQNWGENGQITPKVFGLAKADSNEPFDLDVDKVSRLNSSNLYAISYAEVFKSLKMPDLTLNLEIKPIFEVSISLKATYPSTEETTYQFEVLTTKQGAPVQTQLQAYVFAENYMETTPIGLSSGWTETNITISNSVNGPALLIVFARATCNSRIVSFGALMFAHNSAEPQPNGTFLGLSPLNYSLYVSTNYPETTLANIYALTFSYYGVLQQTANDSLTVYSIPHFADSSPVLIVATGRNSTLPFVEWTAYPQIPVQIGVDFEAFKSLSDIFAYTYIVTLNSAFYECKIQIGGSKI